MLSSFGCALACLSWADALSAGAAIHACTLHTSAGEWTHLHLADVSVQPQQRLAPPGDL